MTAWHLVNLWCDPPRVQTVCIILYFGGFVFGLDSNLRWVIACIQLRHPTISLTHIYLNSKSRMNVHV